MPEPLSPFAQGILSAMRQAVATADPPAGAESTTGATDEPQTGEAHEPQPVEPRPGEHPASQPVERPPLSAKAARALRAELRRHPAKTPPTAVPPDVGVTPAPEARSRPRRPRLTDDVPSTPGGVDQPVPAIASPVPPGAEPLPRPVALRAQSGGRSPTSRYELRVAIDMAMASATRGEVALRLRQLFVGIDPGQTLDTVFGVGTDDEARIAAAAAGAFDAARRTPRRPRREP